MSQPRKLGGEGSAPPAPRLSLACARLTESARVMHAHSSSMPPKASAPPLKEKDADASGPRASIQPSVPVSSKPPSSSGSPKVSGAPSAAPRVAASAPPRTTMRIPHVVASREIILSAPLGTLELFFLGFINGKRGETELTEATRWTAREVRDTIELLSRLGIIRVDTL